MQKVKLKMYSVEFNCMVHYDKYQKGNGHRIDLIDISDGTPVATATVNVPNVKLEKNEVIIKNYSENEGIYDALIKQNIIKHTDKFVKISEFITAPIATLVKSPK